MALWDRAAAVYRLIGRVQQDFSPGRRLIDAMHHIPTICLLAAVSQSDRDGVGDRVVRLFRGSRTDFLIIRNGWANLRILEYEECRLWLVDNSHSERRGGSSGRLRGGGIASEPARESMALVATALNAAAPGMVARSRFDVSNMRMIPEVARLDTPSGFSRAARRDRPDE